MKLFDGRDTLVFEREGDTVTVFLTGAQIRMASMDAIRRHVSFGERCPEEYQAALTYQVIPGSPTLRRAGGDAKTRLAKLQLAQSLATLAVGDGVFRVPFLHPDNVVITGAGACTIHTGLLGMVAPMAADPDHVLACFKALILSVFHPRMRFEDLVTGASVLRDGFSRQVSDCQTTDEVVALVAAEAAAETERSGRRLVSLPRLRYRLTTVIGAVALIAAVAFGSLTWNAYAIAAPRRDAVIQAQSDFLTGDYGKTLTDLEGIATSDLPKSARYVLAVSSVKLADLSASQKNAVLDNISLRTDDNTLDYWIALARGQLDRALDLAQNIGDDQLTLLAYTDLYDATKLDTKMDGAQKQKALEDYAKKIDELSVRLGMQK